MPRSEEHHFVIINGGKSINAKIRSAIEVLSLYRRRRFLLIGIARCRSRLLQVRTNIGCSLFPLMCDIVL
jgi:hypothetical protein